MRHVVYGAGAIGLLAAAGLSRAGGEVVVIARGENAVALRGSGVTYVSPRLRISYPVRVCEAPGAITFGAEDVVYVSVKSQAMREVVAALSSHAPLTTPIVCLQNGVSNERDALRCFDAVWGVNVGCPAAHPAPGTVYSYAAPGPGRLEFGRWAGSADWLSADLAGLFRLAGFEAVVSPDIRAAKYGTLLFNLPNAIDALCGRSARSSRLAENVVAEGASCLHAAGIPFVERDERAQLAATARFAPIDGEEFPGGSTAQSLDKGTGVETDYLNGEISLLGRLHGFPTPLNTGLQRLMAQAAAVQPRQPRVSVERLAELLAEEV